MTISKRGTGTLFSTLALSVLLLGTQAFAGDTKAALEELKKGLNRLGEVSVEGKTKVGDKEVGTLKFGTRVINGNFDVVDAVKKSKGGTATVFVKEGGDYIRVSTNVLKDDGTRAIGTPLAHNKAFDAIEKGETYCGDIEILGKQYDTCYEPIKSKAGATVGIYYVGYPK